MNVLELLNSIINSKGSKTEDWFLLVNELDNNKKK